ncbi:MurR/RpiR family transcriptional regulator (plasmid) [Photobacterium sp. GJ3]|uniref:MurR/RpiR family transcriptional regulator n=1 Tax=Photobacterium sp. GJ3 TaxID=2829502 RepID=UPI001B8CDE66|nr:MurR/RpiR family transcriptional regulator [Photobacterium sp. GJ3]QUJ70237.1 MurR/RpiR family transcriptional regulator [Photobacterium sp. GJ3]
MNILNSAIHETESLKGVNQSIWNYLQVNKVEVAFMTISEFSQSAGCSLSSINRFVKAIGFAGYNEFQKQLQAEVKVQFQPMNITKEIIKGDGCILHDIIASDMRIIESVNTIENQIKIDDWCNKISNSDTIYIHSSRSSYSLAYYIHFLLKNFIKNVILLDDSHSNLSNSLQFVSSNDILISFSFSRYTKQTVDVATYFSELNCNVLAVTDSFQSPISMKKENTMVIENVSGTFTFAAPMIIANVLVSTLAKNNRTTYEERMKQQVKLAEHLNTYN